MIKDLKNLELLRYQLSSRVNKNFKKNSNQSQYSSDKIISAVFSAASSIVIGYLTDFLCDSKNFFGVILGFLSFVIIYLLVYFASKKFIKYVHNYTYNNAIHGKNISQEKIKEIIDDFDHIVCDNNLNVKIYIEAFDAEKDNQLKEFIFYEIYYYTNVAAQKTSLVMKYNSECLNSLYKNSAIDVFRVDNQLNMMNSAKDFLKNNQSKINIATQFNSMLDNQIEQLSNTLARIEYEYQQYVKENFKDQYRDKLS